MVDFNDSYIISFLQSNPLTEDQKIIDQYAKILRRFDLCCCKTYMYTYMT